MLDRRFQLISFSSSCPYKNIALDEVLLLKSIKGRDAYLRLWQNTQKSIYLGLGKKVDQEIHKATCFKDKIPIIRRFSGGGTVFHNRGVLNYALTFPLEKFSAMEGLSDSYSHILKWINHILRPLSIFFDLKGSSDFCLNSYKIAGNAQARRSKIILHHGSIMLSSQKRDINRYLKEPSIQPKYRQKKKHNDFVSDLFSQNHKTNLKNIEALIKHSPWIKANTLFSSKDHRDADKLKKNKYECHSWNFKI